MKPVTALAILLAGTFLKCAHADHHDGWGWNDFQRLDRTKRLAPVRKSAVENWPLLCDELCGAGFGWPACGSLCSRKTTQRRNVVRLAGFCPVLCEYGFGGSICVCPIRVNPKNNYDNVCNEFCIRKNFFVKGCRRCDDTSLPSDLYSISGMFLNTTESAQSNIMATAETINVASELPNSTRQTTKQSILSSDALPNTTLASAAAVNQPKSSPLSDLSTLAVTTSTQSAATTLASASTVPQSTTTIQATTSESGSAENSPTTVSSTISTTGASMPTTELPPSSTTNADATSITTPKWEEWCKKLCTIGEGGAACRCDLLPLKT